MAVRDNLQVIYGSDYVELKILVVEDTSTPNNNVYITRRLSKTDYEIFATHMKEHFDTLQTKKNDGSF